MAISNDVGSGCSTFVGKASPADADTPLVPRDDSIAFAFGGDVDGSERRNFAKPRKGMIKTENLNAG